MAALALVHLGALAPRRGDARSGGRRSWHSRSCGRRLGTMGTPKGRSDPLNAQYDIGRSWKVDGSWKAEVECPPPTVHSPIPHRGIYKHPQTFHIR
jgi:hypothetical protein